MAQAMGLFRIIELSKAEIRAKQAYATEPRAVAIWELSQLVDSLEEAREGRSEGPKGLALKLFLVHARLARLYNLEGNQKKAQVHFEEAIRYYNPQYPSAAVGSFQGMLDRLQQFDLIEGRDTNLATPFPPSSTGSWK